MPASHSPARTLRERQQDVTRDVIVDALIDLLEKDGAFEFSFFELARRSGVSVRTIYRYFPTREDLFDEVSQRVNSRVGFQTYPTTREEILALVQRLFPAFDRERSLILAQIKTGIGREVRAHAQKKRVEALVSAVAQIAPNLPPERHREVGGAIGCLMSADCWLRLRNTLGMDGEESAKTIGWAMEALFDSVAAENARLGKRHQATTKKRGR